MSVRQSTQIGNPILKVKNKTVKDVNDPRIKQLIVDLKDTMHKVGLIGMAAPQIGENYAVFVTEPRRTNTRPKDQSDTFRVYINPKIVSFSKGISIIFEGCGSVLSGQIFGPVKRPRKITVEALDEHGKKFRLTCDGILARVIQHECDHLNGIEFMEKVSDYKQLMVVDYYIQNIKSRRDHIAASHISVISHDFVS